MSLAGSLGFLGNFSLPSVSAPTNLTPKGLMQHYGESHAASRNSNQALAEKIAAGYDSVQRTQQAALDRISNEYRARQRAVVGGLQGANQANLRDIARQYTRLSGQQAQDLIDRGLGNSTIQSSVQRGIQHAYSDARTRSQNDFATSIANMRSQWGMASLQQQQQAALANSGLATQQLNWMNSINVGYPDMGAYAQMAAMGQGGGGGGGPMGGGGVTYGDMSRPIGGPGPQGAGFYVGGDFASGDPYGGYNMYANGPNSQSFSNPAVTSGYGHDYDGTYTPSYDTSPQDSWGGYGGGQSYADLSSYYASQDPMY